MGENSDKYRVLSTKILVWTGKVEKVLLLKKKKEMILML